MVFFFDRRPRVAETAVFGTPRQSNHCAADRPLQDTLNRPSCPNAASMSVHRIKPGLGAPREPAGAGLRRRSEPRSNGAHRRSCAISIRIFPDDFDGHLNFGIVIDRDVARTRTLTEQMPHLPGGRDVENNFIAARLTRIKGLPEIRPPALLPTSVVDRE